MRIPLILTAGLHFLAPRLPAQQAYYPPPGDAWEHREPRTVNVDPAALAEAVKFAQQSAIPWKKNLAAQLALNTAKEPYPDILGPFQDWEAPSGIILRHGYIVAEWGDTRRVDLTFSVAKSYLSTVAGLVVDRGLITDVGQAVGALVKDGGFDSNHNRAISWQQLLTQTSEWEGTLWGKPDVADRRAGHDRQLHEPGTFWEYNDVRVNRLALSLLRVWQRPLPAVLKEYVMDPIVSERWIDMATTPTPLRPVYGYLWWLNTDRKQYPNASARSFFALGAGGNVIWIDPNLDMVVVVRWLDPARFNDFAGKVVAAFAGP